MSRATPLDIRDRRLVARLHHSSQGPRCTTREGLRRHPSREPLWSGTRTFATPPVLNDMGPGPDPEPPPG